MEKRNEPLLLRPAGKDYLWGGKRLNDEYGKNIELSPLAETWECSTHPDGVSTVRCGTFDKMELTAVIKAHPEYLGQYIHEAPQSQWIWERFCPLDWKTC